MITTITTQDRFRGSLLGLAVGDAVGTAVEFMPRGSFETVTDMLGGGPFGLKPGQWTDDTSMALCLAESLIEKQGFDARDQMDRYIRWYRDGHLSSTGKCFDIGNATSDALRRFERTEESFSGSTDPRSAGNGSLMRLAPIPMFFYPDTEKAVQYAAESSRTTHGAAECVDACKLYACMLTNALDGKPKDEILSAPDNANLLKTLSPKIQAIAAGAYKDKTEDQIRGTGYVVESWKPPSGASTPPTPSATPSSKPPTSATTPTPPPQSAASSPVPTTASPASPPNGWISCV